MKPIGNTYLIKCEEIESIENEGGIYVINDVNKVKDSFWKGVIVEYGTTVDPNDKELLPIGTKVIFDMSKKADAKLVLHGSVYYVRKVEEIIGVIEDD
jgi:co-chaperonin GroES (HSP10)